MQKSFVWSVPTTELMKARKKRENVQRDFLKHTAQEIKSDMVRNRVSELNEYLVNAKDRKYQMWERNALSVDLWSEKILIRKLKYIHENPVRAGLCKYPEEYKYSSALLYKTGIDNPSTKLRGISYALS